MSDILEHPQKAINDFAKARRKAALRSVLSRLTGKPSELLSYDDVRRKLKAIESNSSYLDNIPLNAIIGSVGRYNDFDRLFSPLRNSDQSRWANVKRVMTGMRGVPPIEVYRIGDAYFVKDGNHRVSVAKELGFQTIEAYVTNVHSSVPLSPDIQLDDLIIKAEHADFLDKTALHKLRPESDLSVTVPGQYDHLLEHISVHRYYMGIDEDREVSYEEAVGHWFDSIYLAVTQLITERGLLEDFPERTLTDLYLWVAENRATLEKELGWDLEPEAITQSVAEDLHSQPRLQQLAQTARHHLADDILVAISGSKTSWSALDQALILAAKENARIYGIHVVKEETQIEAEATLIIKDEFEKRCQALEVKAQWAVEAGSVVNIIGKRARWVDLVIANLAYPPNESGLLNLSSGFQSFIRQVPRPILAIPSSVSPLNNALLAFDGSNKSRIALYAASYIAARWKIPLTVLTVNEFSKATRLLQEAKTYLEQNKVTAIYKYKEGNVASTILETITEEENDLLVIGGYEYTALFEPLLGGVLNDILRRSDVPMLICQ